VSWDSSEGGFEELSIPTRRGAELWVRSRAGSRKGAPTLVFCDGLGCSGFVFEKLFPLLREFRLVHFQYTGHGGSSSSSELLAGSVVELASELDDVLLWLGAKAIVVGHSLGAEVAMEDALTGSAKIERLVLVSGVCGRMTHTFKGSNFLARIVPSLTRLYRSAPRFFEFVWRRVPTDAALVCGRFLGDISALVEDAEIAPYFEHLKTMKLAHFLSLLEDLGRHDLTERLSSLGVPALVVAGERDSFTPLRETEKLARILGAKLVVIPGGTHVTPLEDPETIANEIRAFSAIAPRASA
jgi:pimeloyl-ACP methyl ester carboxylesterase